MGNSMKWLTAVIATTVMATSAFAGPLDQGGRGNGGSKSSVRSGHSSARSDSHSGRAFRSSSSESRGRGSERSQRASSNTPILDALRNGSGNNNIGNGQLLRGLGRAYEQERERKYWNDREDDYRDAQRTETIVNGVVSLVGILATANQPQYHVHPAPAPVVVCPPPAPRGHYITERVVVEPGYHANERVWIPDYRDPATGRVVLGHYETHQTWVPPVIQERQVWVQH